MSKIQLRILNYFNHDGSVLIAAKFLLIFTLLFLMVVPIWSNLHGFVEEEILESKLYALTLYYIVCIVLGLYVFSVYGIKKLIRDQYSVLLVFGVLSFWMAIFLGEAKYTPMSIIAPFFMLLFFHIFLNSHEKIDLPALILPLILFFLISPLLVSFSPITIDLPFDLYIRDSFRGFSFGKTQYGYLAGISILVLMWKQYPFRLVWILLLFIGIYMSDNRAAFLALLVSVTYVLSGVVNKASIKTSFYTTFVFFLMLLIVYFGFEYQTKNAVFFQDEGMRTQILMSSIGAILDDFFFGKGLFYQNVYVNSLGYTVEPHNSILQSILNFGIIPTIFWYLLLFKNYLKLTIQGRSYLLYWFIFGLFHPGFDAFLFIPESIIVFVLAICFAPYSKPLFKWHPKLKF